MVVLRFVRPKMSYFCLSVIQYVSYSFFMSLFSETILKWYQINKRDLPWRNTKDPYVIWISEIILQQTRVVQGYQYFLRFIDRFPNISTLAAASEDEVMKYWQGLGYYSRARNLHEAAKSMNGEFPTSYNKVIMLKGVGEYTAAAICSFAYDMPYAVVDGNVYRVLSRYFGIDTPIDTSAGKKVFAAMAQEMLDKKYPSTYNQAIMDFGALQCVPQSPDCDSCPLVDSCLAFARDSVKTLPVKKGKTKVTNRFFNYFFVRIDGDTFVHKRTDNDIWRNLYELPLIETPICNSAEQMLSSDAFSSLFGSVKIRSIHLVAENIKHVLSHQILYTNFYVVELDSNSNVLPNNIRIPITEIERYATSKLIHSLLEKYM